MKALPLLLTLLLPLLLVVAGCNDQVPKNRPYIGLSGQTTDDGDDDDDDTVKRPDGAVYFDQDTYCGCNGGKSILISGSYCTTFCATKSDTEDTLYVSFTVGPEIELNETLQSTRGWCENSLGDGEPACVVRVQSDSADVQISNLSFLGPNSLKVPISSLSKGETYILSLVETGTGSNAKSDSIQIMKSQDGTGNTGGMLGLQPVSNYACIFRLYAPATDVTPDYILSAAKMHYYFIESSRPDPVASPIASIFCHDVIAHPGKDDAEWARLNEEQNALNLWSKGDARFVTTTAGNRTIDASIINDLKELGTTISANTSFFGELKMSSGPGSIAAGAGPSANGLGFYMRSFVDTTNPALPVSYCPKQAHYNSTNPLFNVLGDYIQTDTEGIYLSRREALTYVHPTQGTLCMPDDFLVVRETQMKKVWFYYRNGVAVRPTTDSELRNNTIYFFHPYNEATPTVRQSHQKIYKIVTATEAGTPICTNSNGGTPTTDSTTTTPYQYTSVAPHDKRFGCIPVP